MKKVVDEEVYIVFIGYYLVGKFFLLNILFGEDILLISLIFISVNFVVIWYGVDKVVFYMIDGVYVEIKGSYDKE